MRIQRLLSGLGALALLAACQTTGSPGAEMPGPGTDTCNRASAEHLIGEPEAVLEGLGFLNPVRVIHPGEPVTADEVPARLNILIGPDGRIAAMNCG